MELEGAFAGMEDAPEVVAEPPGHTLDRDLGHQVQIQLRPDPGQRPGQGLGALIGRAVHQVVGSEQAYELPQRGRVVPGPVREAAADHARLKPEVEPRGHQGVVETRHHHDLVDELIVRAPPPPEFLAQRAFLVLGHVLHDQDLEIGPLRPGAGLVGLARFVVVAVVLGVGVPGLAAPVGVGGQRPVDPGHHGRAPVVLTGREQPAHPVEGLHAGEGPEALDGREDIQRFGDGSGQLLDRMLLGTVHGQLGGRFLQGRPGVGPDLPQTVVGVRASWHGNHLRDISPAA